jgi:hypothetical protein
MGRAGHLRLPRRRPRPPRAQGAPALLAGALRQRGRALRGGKALGVLALAALAACAPTPAVQPSIGLRAPADTLAALPFGPAFVEARALGTDPAGRLYVADAGRDLVAVLSPEGLPLETVGGPGGGDHALLSPSGLDPTNGLALFVADAGNGRVQRFSRERQLLASLPVPADAEAALAGRPDAGGRGRPVAVVSAQTGEVYVAEALRGVVLRWDDRRALDRVVGGAEEGRGALREPVSLALAPDGRLFVADAGLGAVLVYDPFGGYLRRLADGTAQGVRGLALGRDRLAVVLPDRVLVYGLDGRLRQAFAFALPAPLVGAAWTEGGLVLLTREQLYRAAP